MSVAIVSGPVTNAIKVAAKAHSGDLCGHIARGVAEMSARQRPGKLAAEGSA